MVGENLSSFGFGDKFLDTTPKAWSMNENIDTLDFIKIKTSALWKTAKKMERQTTD